MILPWHIYAEAEEYGVGVHFMEMEKRVSLSVPGNFVMDTRRLPTTEQETTAAAHELSHVLKHAFYNVHSPIDNRQKCENKANRHAILHYVDGDELQSMMEREDYDLPQIAQHFGFTEDFMKQAICYYVHGNLDVEHYF